MKSIYIKQYFNFGGSYEDEYIYFITDAYLHLKTLVLHDVEIVKDVGPYVIEEDQEKEKVLMLLRADPILETQRMFYGVKIYEFPYISAAKLLLLGEILYLPCKKKYEYYIGLSPDDERFEKNNKTKKTLYEKYKGYKLEEEL